MEENIQYTNGPERITFVQAFLRLGAGLAGGLAGTIILSVLFMLSSSALNNIFTGEDMYTHPIFIVVLVAIMFLTCLASNIVGPLLISFTNREKYQRTTQTIYQILAFNIVTFLFAIPLYFILSGFGYSYLIALAALQIVLSAVASLIILETIAKNRYLILNIYSILIAVLIAVCVLLMVNKFSGSDSISLIFIVLPLLWSLLGLTQGVFTGLYRLFYDFYGVDWLNVQLTFGSEDYLDEPEVEEEPTEELSGTDFLKK